MIISKSDYSMSSSRAYSNSTKYSSTIEENGVKETVESQLSHFTNQSNFKDILNNEKTADNDSPLANSKSTYDSGNMDLKKDYSIKSTSSKEEKMSAKRVREMTLLYLLIRIRNSIYKTKGLSGNEGASEISNNSFSDTFNSANIPSASFNIGANMGYRSISEYFSYEESETTSFETTGKVVTADGREIDFNVSLKMSRSFKEVVYGESSSTYALPNFCDPLVINLNNNVSSVDDQEFTFDIDSDGTLESLKALNKNSGFIALDLNEDGVINDGSELFGTKSGNGFADLAKYDSDGNGWIDEADEIFDKLIIWTKDENGKDVLYHLKDKGVGAISLGSIQTDFSLNDLNTNKANAMIRQSGFFLYEDGGVGTMQQLDLAT